MFSRHLKHHVRDLAYEQEEVPQSCRGRICADRLACETYATIRVHNTMPKTGCRSLEGPDRQADPGAQATICR